MKFSPDFLIIGAQKAGTTSLYKYLMQHPHVFMPELKEPQYYAGEKGQDGLDIPIPGDQKNEASVPLVQTSLVQRSITTQDAYDALFKHASVDQLCGESSTWYLYSPKTPKRVLADNPQAKIIAVLRQPVDRAYSAYLHYSRLGIELPSRFEDVFALASRRTGAGWMDCWHIVNMSMYSKQVKRWLRIFPSRQLRFFIYEEDYQDKTDLLLEELFEFLKLDPTVHVDTNYKHNRSGISSNPFRQGSYEFIKNVGQVFRGIKPYIPRQVQEAFIKTRDSLLTTPDKLADGIRKDLTQSYFDKQLQKIEELLNRNLNVWRS